MSEVRGGKAGYHHGDLRNALVEAASELARGGGPEAVVLREAARRVGVSPTAAYRHFDGQVDLLHAVKAAAQRRLVASMEKVITESGEPAADRAAAAKARFWALGLGYVRFAVEEPGLYRTAFCRVRPEPPWLRSPEDRDAHPGDFRSFDLLVEVLDELDAAGALRPGVREGAEFAAWSGAHGVSMLILDGPLDQFPAAEREAVVHRTLAMILDGLTR